MIIINWLITQTVHYKLVCLPYNLIPKSEYFLKDPGLFAPKILVM